MLLCLAVFWLGGDIAWAVGTGPAETMTRVARDLGLQVKMPTDKAPPEPEIHFSDAHWHMSSDVSTGILVAAVLLACGFALFALRDTLPFVSRHRAKPRPGATVLSHDVSVERLAAAGDDAHELARRGQFAQAMHMLLLRSLAELRQSLDVTIADSLTSREIVEQLTLPERGRVALADLIERVERVHFGSRAAGTQDYDAARSSFETLLGLMRTPPAAA